MLNIEITQRVEKIDEEMLFHPDISILYRAKLSNWLTLTKKNGKVRHIEIEHTTGRKKFVSLEFSRKIKKILSFASKN